MASEHDYPPPLPPPPPPPPLSLAPSSPQVQGGQTSPLRRIVVQPPLITTALAPPPQGTYLHSHTPVSATTLSVPFSPYAPSPSSYAASPVSSPMAMRNQASMPYNPQQWGRGGPIGGQYVPYLGSQPSTGTSRSHEVTGMEGNSIFLYSRPSPHHCIPNFTSVPRMNRIVWISISLIIVSVKPHDLDVY